MLKLFKRQKSRRISSSSSSIDGTNCDVGYNNNDNCTNNNKRHSLRSTSSFCDEVLEELAAQVADEQQQTCDEDVASIGGGLSLGSGSICTNLCHADEDIFKYQSRLSISLESIVNDQKCLSYFVQYLETKNALPLIKFYLDTENFKTAAVAQLEKSQENSEKHKCPHQDEQSSSVEHTPTKICTNYDHDNVCSTLGNTDGKESTEEEEHNNVPELKTLYDLSMRKPLTDDEKSQIYAETNKQISKSTNQKFNSSSELSLCSESTTTTEPDLSSSLATLKISAASTKDAIVIYQKYLIANAVLFVSLPVALLSHISLLLCKRHDEKATVGTDEIDASTSETSAAISTCCFDEAQQYVLQQLERDYSNDFLQSTFYCKYCIELIEGTTIDKQDEKLTIYDILYSEVALFFFMEYLEQRGERDCLDFWTTAINFRKSYSNPTITTTTVAMKNESEIQADAMIIYERFFSLQSECRLWLSDKLRSWVEERICADGYVAYCFDLPLQITAKYLEQKYFSDFLNSQLFENYVNELKTKIHEDSTVGHLANGLVNSTLDSVAETGASASPSGISGAGASAGAIIRHKLSLRRTNSKTQNCHRKALSDCTNESTRELFKHISQQNTLLAMDSTHLKHLQASGTNLSIDARHLTNPNLLWHRNTAQEGGLKFGSVNALGRYERDFEEPYGSNNKYNWSLAKGGSKIKNAMRKLVNLPEEKVQEEIAWQVAEMIVKDVTSITLSKENATKIWQ